MKHKLLVLGTIFLMAGSSNQPASIDSQVDELYAQMSMEERVAQLRSGFMNDLFDEAGSWNFSLSGNSSFVNLSYSLPVRTPSFASLNSSNV